MRDNRERTQREIKEKRKRTVRESIDSEITEESRGRGQREKKDIGRGKRETE